MTNKTSKGVSFKLKTNRSIRKWKLCLDARCPENHQCGEEQDQCSLHSWQDETKNYKLKSKFLQLDLNLSKLVSLKW